jgi:hypothetical protein
MVAHFGLARGAAYMRHVQDNAPSRCAAVIGALRTAHSSCRWTTARDPRRDPSIAPRAAPRATSADVAQQPNNFNAPARSPPRVLYVFRTLGRRRDSDERRLPRAARQSSCPRAAC